MLETTKQLVKGEDSGQLRQSENRQRFEERSQGACGEETKPYPTPNSITSQQGVAQLTSKTTIVGEEEESANN